MSDDLQLSLTREQVKRQQQILKIPSSRRTEKDLNAMLASFSQVTFIQDLAPNERTEACRYMQVDYASKDQVVFRQGDVGDKFYLILFGSVGVFTSESAAEAVDAEAGKRLVVNSDAARLDAMKPISPIQQDLGGGDSLQNRLAMARRRRSLAAGLAASEVNAEIGINLAGSLDRRKSSVASVFHAALGKRGSVADQNGILQRAPTLPTCSESTEQPEKSASFGQAPTSTAPAPQPTPASPTARSTTAVLKQQSTVAGSSMQRLGADDGQKSSQSPMLLERQGADLGANASHEQTLARGPRCSMAYSLRQASGTAGGANRGPSSPCRVSNFMTPRASIALLGQAMFAAVPNLEAASASPFPRIRPSKSSASADSDTSSPRRASSRVASTSASDAIAAGKRNSTFAVDQLKMILDKSDKHDDTEWLSRARGKPYLGGRRYQLSSRELLAAKLVANAENAKRVGRPGGSLLGTLMDIREHDHSESGSLSGSSDVERRKEEDAEETEECDEEEESESESESNDSEVFVGAQTPSSSFGSSDTDSDDDDDDDDDDDEDEDDDDNDDDDDDDDDHDDHGSGDVSKKRSSKSSALSAQQHGSGNIQDSLQSESATDKPEGEVTEPTQPDSFEREPMDEGTIQDPLAAAAAAIDNQDEVTEQNQAIATESQADIYERGILDVDACQTEKESLDLGLLDRSAGVGGMQQPDADDPDNDSNTGLLDRSAGVGGMQQPDADDPDNDSNTGLLDRSAGVGDMQQPDAEDPDKDSSTGLLDRSAGVGGMQQPDADDPHNDSSTGDRVDNEITDQPERLDGKRARKEAPRRHHSRKSLKAEKHSRKMKSIKKMASQGKMSNVIVRQGSGWKPRMTGVKKIKAKTRKPKLVEVASLKAGESFGEIALQTDSARRATVKAKEDTIFATLSRADYKAILEKSYRKQQEERRLFLTGIPVFASTSAAYIADLCSLLQRRSCALREVLVDYCDPVLQIYMISAGQFSVCCPLKRSEGDGSEPSLRRTMVAAADGQASAADGGQETSKRRSADGQGLPGESNPKRLTNSKSIAVVQLTTHSVFGLSNYIRGHRQHSRRLVCDSAAGSVYTIFAKELVGYLSKEQRLGLEVASDAEDNFFKNRLLVLRHLHDANRAQMRTGGCRRWPAEKCLLDRLRGEPAKISSPEGRLQAIGDAFHQKLRQEHEQRQQQTEDMLLRIAAEVAGPTPDDEGSTAAVPRASILASPMSPLALSQLVEMPSSPSRSSRVKPLLELKPCWNMEALVMSAAVAATKGKEVDAHTMKLSIVASIPKNGFENSSLAASSITTDNTNSRLDCAEDASWEEHVVEQAQSLPHPFKRQVLHVSSERDLVAVGKRPPGTFAEAVQSPDGSAAPASSRQDAGALQNNASQRSEEASSSASMTSNADGRTLSSCHDVDGSASSSAPIGAGEDETGSFLSTMSCASATPAEHQAHGSDPTANLGLQQGSTQPNPSVHESDASSSRDMPADDVLEQQIVFTKTPKQAAAPVIPPKDDLVGRSHRKNAFRKAPQADSQAAAGLEHGSLQVNDAAPGTNPAANDEGLTRSSRRTVVIAPDCENEISDLTDAPIQSAQSGHSTETQISHASLDDAISPPESPSRGGRRQMITRANTSKAIHEISLHHDQTDTHKQRPKKLISRASTSKFAAALDVSDDEGQEKEESRQSSEKRRSAHLHTTALTFVNDSPDVSVLASVFAEVPTTSLEPTPRSRKMLKRSQTSALGDSSSAGVQKSEWSAKRHTIKVDRLRLERLLQEEHAEDLTGKTDEACTSQDSEEEKPANTEVTDLTLQANDIGQCQPDSGTKLPALVSPLEMFSETLLLALGDPIKSFDTREGPWPPQPSQCSTILPGTPHSRATSSTGYDKHAWASSSFCDARAWTAPAAQKIGSPEDNLVHLQQVYSARRPRSRRSPTRGKLWMHAPPGTPGRRAHFTP
eukprot:TRINITY_DN3200_c0_g2_i2.p1 TRINITY_DN3200_c0_g2~~TRINITY_DN3200_c0_g2_i2.p1  ORF type:complete len:1950 (-),score=398.97 TRINITY_DN3200_c0_g2_i2:154-6003(-)